MTATSLAQSYLLKALVRLEVLEFYLSKEAFSDVVREAQEAVELMLKAILRQVGVEPPKWHDVGELLVASEIRLPEQQAAQALADARFCAEMAREVIPLPR